MRKILLAALALFTLTVILAVALPIVISSETVRNTLLERAKEITGREMQFSGDPAVLWSPFLGIEIHDVTFHDSLEGENAKPILSMPVLTARLDLSSALRGKVEIDRFKFVRPVFSLHILPSGQSNWAFPDGKVWEALQEATRLRDATPTGSLADTSALQQIGLGIFTVEDGIIEYVNKQTGRNESVTNFNGELNWADTRSPWTFTGNAIWRGEIFNVVTTAQMPVMLLAGGQSAVTTTIRSKPFNLKFTGEMNRLADLYFNGELAVDSPSLRRMVNILGGNTEPGASFSVFSANGTISGTIKQFQLDGAQIVLDGNEGTGTIRLSQTDTKVTKINGTLASALFDARPYIETSVIAGDEDEGTSLLPILDNSEIDIRLSAKKMLVGESEITDFAGGIMAKDGALVVDVGNAYLSEGLIVGKLGAERRDGQLQLTAEMNIGPVNPSNLKFFGSVSAIRPNGTSNLAIKLTTWGRNTDDLAQNLDGSFIMKMERGLLTGLDFSNIRSSIENTDVTAENVPIASTIAQTTVTDFKFSATVNRGVAWIQDSSFNVQDYVAKFSGKADLRFSNLAIWGSLTRESTDSDQPAPHQFFLGGTLNQPLFVPDAYSVIPFSDHPPLSGEPGPAPGN
jgi:AsmA protein